MSDDKSKADKSYLPRSWGKSKPKKAKTTENGAPAPSRRESKKRGSGNSRKAAQQKPEAASAPEPTLVADQSIRPGEPVLEEPADRTHIEAPVCVNAADLFGKTEVEIVGVRFGYACKIYNFDCDALTLKAGNWVVVKTEKGMGLGVVAAGPFKKLMDPGQLEGLRKVLRKAGKADFDQTERSKEKEGEARHYCLDRIDALGLPMKLVSVECFFDGSKYVFYFTAEGRVDFRELVKHLVARFPVRIEMRQIGVRHEAKMTGGLACCGQELCCSRFLVDFRPVSVKMAKNQNLSLNPTKISGVCGRLMCCLGYEHEIYEDFKRGLPRIGKIILTPKGEGIIIKHNPLTESVSLRLQDDTIVDMDKREIVRHFEATVKRNKKAGCAHAHEPEDTEADEYDESLKGIVD